ncbi:MAG: HAD family hydrolase [Kiritimatiellia bacterium]|nr:HAD family hydrolase [Kiritimatiellia bacterium]
MNVLPVTEALIFDLDGTLLDTIDDLTDAMNAALAKQGYPPRLAKEYKRLVGEGADVLASGALPSEARDSKVVTNLIAAYRAEYADIWTRKTKPYPGIVDLLEKLQARNIPMAILSNKRDQAVKQAASHFLPGIPFADVRGVRSLGSLKPDPTAALLIANIFGIAPRNVMFVGDTKTDMQTAISAGMIAVSALWGFRTVNELRSNGAQYLVKHPTDILSLLGVASTAV